MQGQAFLIADVREVVHHRQTVEFVASLTNHSSATSDDHLGEVVVQRYAVIAKGHRGLAIDDECGKARDMQQPPLGGHIIVAIAGTHADVRHLQLHFLIPVELGLLTHS